jgi:hypothetical protein
MSSDPDGCICSHIQRIHFNPILTNDKTRPCSHIDCPCLDLKAANPKVLEQDVFFDQKDSIS